MTQTMTPATTTPSGLRSLHLIRSAFSVVWVALAFATSRSLVADDQPTLVAGALLVAYPLWDGLATLLERRLAGTGAADRVRVVNVVLSGAATVAMAAAVFASLRACLVVFGLWAVVSGALQLTVAIRRWRSVGAQWPMVISGGLSIPVGLSFAVTAGSASAGLSGVAGYSAFGAVLFLLSAVFLALRGRR